MLALSLALRYWIRKDMEMEMEHDEVNNPDEEALLRRSRRPRGPDPECERCGGTGSEFVEPGPDTEHLRGAVPCVCGSFWIEEET